MQMGHLVDILVDLGAKNGPLIMKALVLNKGP
jgi:hypothetical protein